MPEYRIKETGEIITDLKGAFPNASLPAVLTPADLEFLGVDPVLEGPQPATTTVYQFAFRDGIKEINGKWFTKYAIGPVFADYIDDEGVTHTAAEQEAAYKAQKDHAQWEAIRTDRNKRLADTDWTQLDDTPIANTDKSQWALYRQALRDITTQADPFHIEWPALPV
jgi:hypothetical protein